MPKTTNVNTDKKTGCFLIILRKFFNFNIILNQMSISFLNLIYFNIAKLAVRCPYLIQKSKHTYNLHHRYCIVAE